MPRKIFVTTALPYANGPFHIGHIMEYIQADIWVRFQRMQGNEVLFIGADDANGAPIMLAAEKADRKSTRLNSSHSQISYAVFCLKKKKKTKNTIRPKVRRVTRT